MSIEKVTYQQLAILAGSKIVGDTLITGARVLKSLAKGLEDLSDAAFVFEFDAAARYRNLTDTDLGVAYGQPGRYAADSDEELTFVDEDEEEA